MGEGEKARNILAAKQTSPLRQGGSRLQSLSTYESNAVGPRRYVKVEEADFGQVDFEIDRDLDVVDRLDAGHDLRNGSADE